LDAPPHPAQSPLHRSTWASGKARHQPDQIATIVQPLIIDWPIARGIGRALDQEDRAAGRHLERLGGNRVGPRAAPDRLRISPGSVTCETGKALRTASSVTVTGLSIEARGTISHSRACLSDSPHRAKPKRERVPLNSVSPAISQAGDLAAGPPMVRARRGKLYDQWWNFAPRLSENWHWS